MKNITIAIKLFILVLLYSSIGCENVLEEEPFSEFTPGNYLTTEKGINSLLYSAYSNTQWTNPVNLIWVDEFPTDILWETGGGMYKDAVKITEFTWDPTVGWFRKIWSFNYAAIRDANIILENVMYANISDEEKLKIAAEAKFLRAWAYITLYDLFGPVPLIDSYPPETLYPARADEETLKSFIETDLTATINDLPLQQELYGRITRGAALAVLCKYYLNTKQWQKCVNISQEIMDLNLYTLFSSYPDMFKLINERNSEFIYVWPAIPQNQLGNLWMAYVYPAKYPIPPNHENLGAQVRLYDSFVNSFDVNDHRRDLIITEYVTTDGIYKKLLGNDDCRSFKYEPDPNGVGRWHGNDVPVIRYADILLARAEALNELNGPTQETVDLINMIRERAGVTSINLSDFSTKISLRDHILQERAWEFYSEFKRREDLIRHEKFISGAIARGKNAQPFHVLYPLPQEEMDANLSLVQNEGY